MARTKRPTSVEIKKMKLVNLIRDVQSSGSGPVDSWNLAEIYERLKDINYIRRLVDSWNPAELNHALQLLGFKTIDSWNPAIIEEMRTSLIMIFQERTATGNPIELDLSGNLPYEIKSLKLTMHPIQSGTGDPSPSNIRPISGRNSANITISDGETEQTKTITFPSTVYGGTDEVVSGNGTSENLIFLTFTSANYYGTFGDDNAPLFYIDITGYDIVRMNQSNTNGIILSNMLKKITVTSAGAMKNNEIRTEAAGQPTKMYFRMDSFTDETSINAFLAQNPLQVLATTRNESTAFTTTPVTDLELYKGTNIISTDADDIELKYQINLS